MTENMRTIMEASAKGAKVRPDDLTGRSKKKEVVYARKAFVEIADREGMPLTEIASAIERRVHTVRYHLKSNKIDLQYNRPFIAIYEKCKEVYGKIKPEYVERRYNDVIIKVALREGEAVAAYYKGVEVTPLIGDELQNLN